ncbi:MAG: hypothetical protein WAR83_09415 [Flavobacteriales bacterium]|nr:hypothetical protein [Flavobacteriales bacterium]
MAKDNKYRKINEILSALTESERLLSAGALGLEGLESACSNARELFERLVVLRHKAREAALNNSLTQATEATLSVEVPKKDEVEKPLRLDTRPPEVFERQTSLIDAIEATQAEEVIPDKAKATPKEAKPQKATSGSTIAEKMEKASTADLSKIITLSHKFWFVAELFNGDRINYEKSIEKLNGFGDLKVAQAFVADEVVAKLKKPADPEALSTFEELVKRRYA